MDLLVSIVIPVYNVEDYLDECLETVVNQTYKNLQIILVDDGSTDGSSAICDLWAGKDERISVIHKKNEGAGMARNTGIDIACGEYILFFDSDDYVEVSLVEKCVACAKSNQADAVIYGRYSVRDNIAEKEYIVEKERVFIGDSVKNELLPSMFVYKYGVGISPWGKLHRLTVIKKAGIRFRSEREVTSEDSYFSLEFFSSISKVVILPENLYYYRQRSNSLSRNYKKGKQLENNVFLEKCLEFADANAMTETISPYLKSRYHGMTLGTLKQIACADVPYKEKKEQLKLIYKDEVLRKTLTKDIIKLDRRFSKIFWITLKLKLHFLCTVLLNFKVQR